MRSGHAAGAVPTAQSICSRRRRQILGATQLVLQVGNLRLVLGNARGSFGLLLFQTNVELFLRLLELNLQGLSLVFGRFQLFRQLTVFLLIPSLLLLTLFVKLLVVLFELDNFLLEMDHGLLRLGLGGHRLLEQGLTLEPFGLQLLMTSLTSSIQGLLSLQLDLEFGLGRLRLLDLGLQLLHLGLGHRVSILPVALRLGHAMALGLHTSEFGFLVNELGLGQLALTRDVLLVDLQESSGFLGFGHDGLQIGEGRLELRRVRFGGVGIVPGAGRIGAGNLEGGLGTLETLLQGLDFFSQGFVGHVQGVTLRLGLTQLL